MSYERSPYCPALVEAKNMFRIAAKPQIAKAILYNDAGALIEAIMTFNRETYCYVLYSGPLFHYSQWVNDNSYNEIAESYADFPERNYDQMAMGCVGYEDGFSIKDCTHKRRGSQT